MTVSEKLAQFVVGTGYSDIPRQSVEYAKRLTLSTLGSMLWGSTLPAGQIVIKLLKEWGGTPEVGVIGGGFKTSLPNAALAGGNFGHASEWEGDSRPESVGLLTLLPVTFALAEKLGSSGKDVLEATIIGHEVQARIGLACVPATERGFFSVPVFGNFGSAVVAAKLLKLDVRQIIVALSIAASQAAGTIRQSSTMSHFIETGFAARNGLVAAMLAKEGFTADMDIFADSHRGVGFGTAVAGKDGYEIEQVTRDLGNPFRVELIDTKHFPCHSQQQRALDGTLQLVNEHDIPYDEVESVAIELKSDIHEIDLLDPPDGENSRFSIQHGVAGILLEHHVGRGTFTDAKAVDPKFGEARRKVKLIIPPKPVEADTITINLKNGKQYSTSVNSWKGHYTSPLTAEELTAKFKDATGDTLSPNQANRMIELVLNLDDLKDLSELIKILSCHS